MNRLLITIVLAPLGLLAPIVAAQDSPKDGPNETPIAPGNNPLSGPQLDKNKKVTEPTLVERDFAGKVKRLDVVPAEAAVRSLKLDDATRKKVDEAIAKRNAALDGVVRDNLRLIVELAGAYESQKREEAGKLMRELYDKAQPLRDLGPLQASLQAALPEAQRGQFLKMTQDYWNAVIDEKQAEAKEKGEPWTGKQMVALRRAETVAAAGKDIRRAYERVIGQQTRDFEATLKSLNLTEEQESKIRQLVGDQFQKSFGKSTPAERVKVISAVFGVLDAAQRETLLKTLRRPTESEK